MLRKLYSYQENVVKHLQQRENSALYAQMRLGKTLCTIRALKDKSGRKLIVCPKSVIGTWKEEIGNDGIYSYLGFSSNLAKNLVWEIYPHEWLICNYEAVMRLPQGVLDTVKHVVIDESTVLKNPKAKITKFFLNSFKHCNKIILSGNPAPNHPLEYFTQMQFLYGEWMGCKNYWEFRGRYFQSDFSGYQWWLRKKWKEPLKEQLHKDAYILTRKQVGVENKKVYETRTVEMPTKLRKHYQEMEHVFLTSLPSGEEVETKSVLAQLNYLSQMSSGFLKGEQFSNFKIKELESLVTGELKDEYILIWAAYLKEIDEIKTMLRKHGIVHAEITGRNPEHRMDLIKDFQKGNITVLVLQPSTSAMGINLSKADTCIYFSNTNSIQDRDQSEARIQTNQKKYPLLYIDLVTKNSVDSDRLKALKTKKKQSNFYLEMIGGMRERIEI